MIVLTSGVKLLKIEIGLLEDLDVWMFLPVVWLLLL